MGKLSGAFTTKESIDEEDWKRIKQELLDAYGGMDNAGKWAVLDKGLEYQEFGITPSELSFIEGRKLVKEELLNVYGQSIALYSENPNRANADAAERSFLRRTIRPRCIRLAEKLNEKLCPRYDENIFFAWDDPSPEDILIAARVREINIRTGVSAINEERRKMREPPFKDGDEPLVQSQYIPLSLAASGAALQSSNPSSSGKPREGREPAKSVDIDEATRIVSDIIKRRLQEEG
jgi:HK97 family phage portal protein